MLNVGKQIIQEKVVFHYDMKDPNSYIGEPTYNIFYDGSLRSHVIPGMPLQYAGYNYNNNLVYGASVGTINTTNNFGVSCYNNKNVIFYNLNASTKYITVSFYANVQQIVNSSIGNNDKGYLLVEYTDGSILYHQNSQSYYKHNVIPPLNPTHWFNILSNNFNYYEIRYKLAENKIPKGIMRWYIYNDYCSTGYIDICNLQMEEKPYATNYVLHSRSEQCLYDTINNTPLYTDIKYNYNNIFYFNESRIVTNNVQINSSNWTIEFVIKPYDITNASIGQVLINPSNGNYNEISILNDGKIKLVYGDASLYTIYSNQSIPYINNYNIIHITLDSNNILSVYFNGIFDSSQNLKTSINWQSIWNLGIIINPSNYRPYNGELPMLSVYNKILNANEIYNNYITYQSCYN